MKELLLAIPCVAAGGAIGAVCRYLAGVASVRLLGEQFPFGTLAVNVVGCLLMGMGGQLGMQSETLSPPVKAALLVGFLGALTTFSAFGNETFRHLEAGHWGVGLGNVGANVLLGLAAVWGGAAAVKAWVGE